MKFEVKHNGRLYQRRDMQTVNCLNKNKQEAFEKCWAHSPLRAAAHPFSRCRYRYCRAPPVHRCPWRRTTTTTKTRDRGDRYGPMEWAQLKHAINSIKCTSNLADKFLNTCSELVVSKQQHLDDKETYLGVITFNAAQWLRTHRNTQATYQPRNIQSHHSGIYTVI